VPGVVSGDVAGRLGAKIISSNIESWPHTSEYVTKLAIEHSPRFEISALGVVVELGYLRLVTNLYSPRQISVYENPFYSRCSSGVYYLSITRGGGYLCLSHRQFVIPLCFLFALVSGLHRITVIDPSRRVI